MSKKFFITHRLKSFIYAFYGLRYTILTQHNFIIHLVLAIIAIVLGFYLNINSMEWVAIIIVIGLVLSAETAPNNDHNPQNIITLNRAITYKG